MAIPTKNKSNNGVKGLAEVRVLDTALKVIFLADGDTYQVNKNGWDRPSGHYNVTLSKANDEIKFVSPAPKDEPFLVKFLEYGNRVGRSDTNPGVPEPKIKPGGWRQGPNGPYYAADSLVANAKLIVVGKGSDKGLTIFYEVPYVFTQYQGTLIAQLEGTAGERRKVETWLQLTGLDMVNDEIPYSGNVLPWLEAKQQLADKVFQLKLNEKGFVAKDGLSPIPAYLLTPELLGEDDVPAKKAKKSPAKSNGKKAPAKVKKAVRK